MNRAYRVLWSESRQAFIVTHEKAKTKGKSCPTRNAVALAVVTALGAMAVAPAMAATSCPGIGGSTITISGNETSICSLATGDALTVTSSGSINGASPAVAVDGTAATSIDNSGTLAGTVWGIDIYHSGSVTGAITNNDAISGAYFGIHIVTGSSVGSITNNAGGTIAGTGGIGLFTSSSVTGGISNSGAITGGSYGIGLKSSSLTGGIVNSGTISGVHGVYLVNGSSVDSITNDSSGTISGNIGIDIVNGSSVTSIVNDGLITANTGIRLSSVSTVGSITNSGTITASTGIRLSSGSVVGSITNNGSITGYNGIYLQNSSSITNAITNNLGGTISGSSSGAAILLSSGSSVGSIVNDGTISGGAYGILLQGSSSVTGSITNSGTISGSSNGIYLSSGSSVGGIVNSGTITGRDGAVLISSSTVGSITNELGGTISGTGQSGLRIGNYSTISGGIINDGTITGGQTGLYISGNSTVTGDITNTGTIEGVISSSSGTGYGISIAGNSTVGSITNSGTIQGVGGTSGGSGYGIYVNNGNIGSISNSGTINGAGQNYGAGIYLVSGSTVTGSIINQAAGVISGNSAGIALYSSSSIGGGITNSGTISGNYAIDIRGGSSVTGDITNSVGGTISGTGSGAAIRLSGNSIVGGIVNAGTIAGGQTGLSVSGSSTVTGGITNSGTISGGTNAIYIDSSSTVGGITNTGTINGAVVLGGTTLNLNGTAGSISGAVTGGAGSTVNVNGTFTTGDTFAVDTFNIAIGGLLNMGHGITTTAGFSNAGTLAVAEAGNVIVTGDYTQAAGGTYRVGAASNTVYGKLNVTGTATLPAAAKIDVNVNSVNTLASGNTLTGVLTAGTLSASTFTVTDNSVLFDFTGVINGNAIDLTIAGGSTTGVVDAVTATGNTSALGAAAVFDVLIAAVPGGDMGSVITALGALSTQQGVSDAVTQTLPLMTGGMTQLAFSRLRSVNHVVQVWQGKNLGLSSGDGFISDHNAWVKPIGSWADQKDRDGAYGYSAQTFGLVAGADGAISQASRLGAAFAYTRSAVDSNTGAQTADVDSYQVVLYGSHDLDERTELNLQADLGHNKNTGKRHIALVNRTASSDYTSSSVHLGAGVGRKIELNPKTSFIPSVRADYTTIRDQGYTETGAGALNLVVDGESTDEFILGVDGKVNHAISEDSTLTANLGVGHDTQAEQSSITSAYQGGGAAFTTNGIKPSATLVRGGAGVVMNSSKMMEITLRYDFETRSGFTGQTASIKLRMPF